MQGDLTTAYNNIKPVVKRIPGVLKQEIEHIKFMVAAAVAGREPSDQEYVQASKALMKSGGPVVKDLVEALKRSPIQSIHDKWVGLNLKTITPRWFSGTMLTWVNDHLDMFTRWLKAFANLAAGKRRRRRRM